MKKLPIACGGETVGDAEREDERLYIRVNVRVALRRGLWCAWGIGGRGDVRIGVLEPVNGESVISRRFSRRSLADAGEFSRVELRPVESGVGDMEAHIAADHKFPGLDAYVPAFRFQQILLEILLILAHYLLSFQQRPYQFEHWRRLSSHVQTL